MISVDSCSFVSAVRSDNRTGAAVERAMALNGSAELIGSDQGDPPTHRVSDYVEIGILAFMILVGGPLNIVAFVRTLSVLLATKRQNSNIPTVRGTSRLTVFKLHLNIANLMVLATYAISQISWLITYQWLGGDVICRIVKFFHTFCFYATSNLVAAIAVDRLWVMFNVQKPNSVRSRRSTGRLQVCAWTAWTIAFICSIPQFFLWRTIEAWPNWYQCVTLWTATSVDDASTSSKLLLYEKIYGGLHLALVFWSPGLIIISCYALIVAKFHVYENRSRNSFVSAPVNDQSAPTRGNSSEKSHRQRYSCGSYLWPDGTNESVANTHEDVPVSHNCQLQQLQKMSTVSMMADPANASASLLCRPLLESISAATLRRAKKRTLKKTAWLLLCYIICWSPYNVVALWRHFFNPTFENIFLDSFYNLIVLNAVVNPLVYGL